MQPGYFRALSYAVILHGLLLLSLSFGFSWRQFTEASAPPLAIQAKVVDESMIEAELAKLEAADERIREAEDQRRRDLQAQADKARAEREAEEARLAALERERVAAEQRNQEQARQLETETRERQAREKRESAERQAKADVEKQRLAELEQSRVKEEQRLAALAEQRREEEQARARAAKVAREAALQDEREEQLRRAMAEETARREAEDAGLLDEYITLIRQRIERNWIQPPGTQASLRCELLLTQIPGGEVTDVRIGSCNGDAAVVRSLEAAVYKASPLPPPPDPRLFERKVRVLFEPEN